MPLGPGTVLMWPTVWAVESLNRNYTVLLFGSSIGPQSSGGTISLTAGNILRIFLRRVESFEDSTEELQDWEKK